MSKKFLIFLLILSPLELFASREIGCSIADLIKGSQTTPIKISGESNCTKETSEGIEEKRIAITPHLNSISLVHENRSVTIERKSSPLQKSCPPFCIEPMKIEGVETVGELEVLMFIDRLKERGAQLLVDVRKNRLYRKETIPGAINLPSEMLEDRSKYKEEILKLLGGEIINKESTIGWSFRHAQRLLIFGESAGSSEASRVIKKLLKLGYPSAKLLFYRGGISSWKALGLTTI